MRALKVGSSSLASSLQLGSGMNVRRSRLAEQPLELYSFETSPYSRLVCERLCELELPYLLLSTAKGTPKDPGPPAVRDRWFKIAKGTTRNLQVLLVRAGHVNVPYPLAPQTSTKTSPSNRSATCR